ncbi:MAG: hypothetical protein DI640_15140, partial [Sphingomonas taxi]
MSFNPAVFSIRNRLLILLVIIGTIVAGMAAYGSLPRFEDPEFTIRRAVVVTPYPGGSPMEVATEVTQRLEREIGQMQEVKEIVSTSEAGQLDRQRRFRRRLRHLLHANRRWLFAGRAVRLCRKAAHRPERCGGCGQGGAVGRATRGLLCRDHARAGRGAGAVGAERLSG